METMSLTEHFGLKLKLTQTSLLFLKEDSNLKETVSTINSNVLILSDVKEKIQKVQEFLILECWSHLFKLTEVNMCFEIDTRISDNHSKMCVCTKLTLV